MWKGKKGIDADRQPKNETCIQCAYRDVNGKLAIGAVPHVLDQSDAARTDTATQIDAQIGRPER